MADNKLSVGLALGQEGGPELAKVLQDLTRTIAANTAQFEQWAKGAAASADRITRAHEQIKKAAAGGGEGEAGLFEHILRGARVASGRSILGGMLGRIAMPLGAAYGMYRLGRYAMESVEGSAEPAAQFEMQAGNLQRRLSTHYPISQMIRTMGPERTGSFGHQQFLQMASHLQELSGIRSPQALMESASNVARFARVNALQPEQVNQLMGTAIRSMPLEEAPLGTRAGLGGRPESDQDFWGRMRTSMEVGTRLGVDRAETMRGMLRATQTMSQSMGVFDKADQDAVRKLIDVLNLSGNRALQGERGMGALQGLTGALGQPMNPLALMMGMEAFYPGGKLTTKPGIVPPDRRKALEEMGPIFGTKELLENLTPMGSLAMLDTKPKGSMWREVMAQQLGVNRRALARLQKQSDELGVPMAAFGTKEGRTAAIDDAVKRGAITKDEGERYKDETRKAFDDFSNGQKDELMEFQKMNASLARSEFALHTIAEKIVPTFREMEAKFFTKGANSGSPQDRLGFMENVIATNPDKEIVRWMQAKKARLEEEEYRKSLGKESVNPQASDAERQQAARELEERQKTPLPPHPHIPPAARRMIDDETNRSMVWGFLGGMMPGAAGGLLSGGPLGVLPGMLVGGTLGALLKSYEGQKTLEGLESPHSEAGRPTDKGTGQSSAAPRSILDRLAALSFKSGAAEAAEIETAGGGDPATTKMLRAIRLAEAGGRGKEFGVESEYAPTFQKQLAIATKSIRNAEARFQSKHGMSARDARGDFTDAFFKDFSARWAEDPHHSENLRRLYRQQDGSAGDVTVNVNMEGAAPRGIDPISLADRVRGVVKQYMDGLNSSHESPYYQKYNTGS